MGEKQTDRQTDRPTDAWLYEGQHSVGVWTLKIYFIKYTNVSSYTVYYTLQLFLEYHWLLKDWQTSMLVWLSGFPLLSILRCRCGLPLDPGHRPRYDINYCVCTINTHSPAYSLIQYTQPCILAKSWQCEDLGKLGPTNRTTNFLPFAQTSHPDKNLISWLQQQRKNTASHESHHT